MVSASVIPDNGPVARAPAPLKAAAAAAGEAFEADPTAETWATLSAAVLACIDHDDAQKRSAA